MGKSRPRRQDVVILTEANSVDDVRIDADVVHAEAPEVLKAWALNSLQQAKDEYTGRYVQVVSERSYKPIQIYRSKGSDVVGSTVAHVASETEDEEMTFLEERKGKDGRLLWIGIITGLLVLTFCIIVLVVVV